MEPPVQAAIEPALEEIAGGKGSNRHLARAVIDKTQIEDCRFHRLPERIVQPAYVVRDVDQTIAARLVVVGKDFLPGQVDLVARCALLEKNVQSAVLELSRR